MCPLLSPSRLLLIHLSLSPLLVLSSSALSSPRLSPLLFACPRFGSPLPTIAVAASSSALSSPLSSTLTAHSSHPPIPPTPWRPTPRLGSPLLSILVRPLSPVFVCLPSWQPTCPLLSFAHFSLAFGSSLVALTSPVLTSPHLSDVPVSSPGPLLVCPLLTHRLLSRPAFSPALSSPLLAVSSPLPPSPHSLASVCHPPEL